MSLYFSHILKSVNYEWFIYFYRTDFECFQILFDIKKQTRCHLLVNVRRFIETVQYCPLLGSFPCLWQLKIAYIIFVVTSVKMFSHCRKNIYFQFLFLFSTECLFGFYTSFLHKFILVSMTGRRSSKLLNMLLKLRKLREDFDIIRNE